MPPKTMRCCIAITGRKPKLKLKSNRWKKTPNTLWSASVSLNISPGPDLTTEKVLGMF